MIHLLSCFAFRTPDRAIVSDRFDAPAECFDTSPRPRGAPSSSIYRAGIRQARRARESLEKRLAFPRHFLIPNRHAARDLYRVIYVTRDNRADLTDCYSSCNETPDKQSKLKARKT